MNKRIKDTYQKYLWIFISANAIIFWTVCYNNVINIDEVSKKFEVFLDKKSILFIISPIASLVLSGFLPNSIKEILVFWRLHNRLPGCRAFSYFANHDHRIDIKKLKSCIGEFPQDPIEQNRKWYRLYKENNNDKVISGSHRDFLLTRDLCAISFIFIFIFLPITFLYLHSNTMKIQYATLIIVQYLILSVTSRNFGNRFVCNVLTIAANKC